MTQPTRNGVFYRSLRAAKAVSIDYFIPPQDKRMRLLTCLTHLLQILLRPG